MAREALLQVGFTELKSGREASAVKTFKEAVARWDDEAARQALSDLADEDETQVDDDP